MTLTTEELREPRCVKCGRKASDHNVRHPFQPSHQLPSVYDLAAEALALRAEVERLRKALSDLLELDDDYSPFGGELLHDRVERTWEAARAAIRKKEVSND